MAGATATRNSVHNPRTSMPSIPRSLAKRKVATPTPGMLKGNLPTSTRLI